MDSPIPQARSFLDEVEIGVGTWAWGDRHVWGYGSMYGETDVNQAFDAAVRAGGRFFDTAEVYGGGESERLLGQYRKASTQPIRIGTKFMPFPWRWRTSELLAALRRSLARLGMARVDLYQLHAPLPPRAVTTWMEACIEAVGEGLVAEIGVSNYSERQMRAAADRLARAGLRLASNQVEYSLLKRRVEWNGVARACRELDVRLMVYSPLAMGLLSGAYSAAAPPKGYRRVKYRKALPRLAPILGLLEDLGRAHGGKTGTQVALNWVICKGALPIPGPSTRARRPTTWAPPGGGSRRRKSRRSTTPASRSALAARDVQSDWEMTMARHTKEAHLYELAKRGAEERLGELVQEVKLLVGLFPHLRDSFDKDELPLPFIIATNSGGLTKSPGAGRRTVSATARRAMSRRMKSYWAKRKATKA